MRHTALRTPRLASAQTEAWLKRGRRVEQLPDCSAVRVSHRQMWFDLFAAGVTAEKTELQANEVLLALWNQLHPDQQFTFIPGKATTHEVQLADYFPDYEFGRDTGWWGS